MNTDRRTRGGWFAPRPSGSVTWSRSTPLRRLFDRLRWSGGFRRVQFNAAGWAALLGPGVLVGGAAAAWRQRRIVNGMLAGAALAWAGGVAYDSWRWSRDPVQVHCSELDETDLDELSRRLDAAIIPAVVGKADPSVGPTILDSTGTPMWVVVTQQRHVAKVQDILASLPRQMSTDAGT